MVFSFGCVRANLLLQSIRLPGTWMNVSCLHYPCVNSENEIMPNANGQIHSLSQIIASSSCLLGISVSGVFVFMQLFADCLCCCCCLVCERQRFRINLRNGVVEMNCCCNKSNISYRFPFSQMQNCMPPWKGTQSIGRNENTNKGISLQHKYIRWYCYCWRFWQKSIRSNHKSATAYEATGNNRFDIRRERKPIETNKKWKQRFNDPIDPFSNR